MSNNRKKILVIGGAGYIGGLVVDKLQESGFFELCVYDNLLYEERYLKPVPFVYGDIRDTKNLLNIATKFENVVFLAALVGDPACNVNPALTEEVNFQAVKRFCQGYKDHVVFMSTCSVYGANSEVVYEDGKTNPLSSYASTKLKAEKYIDGTIFRLGTVYGVGDNFSRIRADLVVNTLTIKAFTEGEITINGGEQYRPIISVKDIANYVVEACDRKIKGSFNLHYKNVRIAELANDIEKEFPSVKIKYIDQMYQDERNYKVESKDLHNIFYYKAKVTVAEEIKELHSLLKEKRIKNPHDINYNNGLFLAHKRI